MSFRPIPASFHELARTLSSRPDPRVVDLGCGRGELGRWLAPHGVPVVGLDLLGALAEGAVALVGDALHPPLLPGRLDALLAGNLLHHLQVQGPGSSYLQWWLELLKPGGCLYLLGDHPEKDARPAVRNYHKFQAFLADILPGVRGPLLARDQVLQMIPRSWSGSIRHGLETHLESPDAQEVMALLEGEQGTAPGSTAGELRDAIARHGIEYGRFWWIEAQAPT